MAGGLMQLVAYGAQDVYLTGKPSVTFFQAVYKRHTNFAMETIQQTLNGTVGNGNRVSVTIARNGDLVGYMYVELTPVASALRYTSNDTSADVNWMAERAFSAIELTIGGQRIDKHYQTWWRLYAELFLSDEAKIKYGKMTTSAAKSSTTGLTTSTVDASSKVYLPLLFFFNRNPGLYLPLIALQYHEVRLDFDCATNFSTFFDTSTQPVVWANYVFLDTEERRRFAQKSHEYLIEQVQHTGGDSIGGASSLIRLSLNHPVKELIWCYQDSGYSMASASKLNALWSFSSNCSNVQVTIDANLGQTPNTVSFAQTVGVPRLLVTQATTSVQQVEEGVLVTGAQGAEVGPLSNFKLILNGQDRFKEQPGKYFNQVHPYFHHTGAPYPGIYNYSFALHPEEHQPTGTCNFSRIDNAQVQVNLKSTAASNKTQKLFAVNYNVLRISSGMGGLAFSN